MAKGGTPLSKVPGFNLLDILNSNGGQAPVGMFVDVKRPDGARKLIEGLNQPMQPQISPADVEKRAEQTTEMQFAAVMIAEHAKQGARQRQVALKIDQIHKSDTVSRMKTATALGKSDLAFKFAGMQYNFMQGVQQAEDTGYKKALKSVPTWV